MCDIWLTGILISTLGPVAQGCDPSTAAVTEADQEEFGARLGYMRAAFKNN